MDPTHDVVVEGAGDWIKFRGSVEDVKAWFDEHPPNEDTSVYVASKKIYIPADRYLSNY